VKSYIRKVTSKAAQD